MNDSQYHDRKFKGVVCAPRTRRSGNVKNTRLWCRGKVGRAHVAEWKNWNEIPSHSGSRNGRGWQILICMRCEKQLERHMPWPELGYPCDCSQCAK